MEGAQSTTTPDKGFRSAPWYLTANGGLYNTPSFKWLIAAIEASCRLDYAGATAISSIKDILDSSLGLDAAEEIALGIRPGEPSFLPRKVTLETNWDPLRFIKQQGYKGPGCLPGVLTLSGTANNTQVLTCRQYLRQTWPFAGEVVLEALVDWIKAASSDSDGPHYVQSRSTLATHDGCVNPYEERH